MGTELATVAVECHSGTEELSRYSLEALCMCVRVCVGRGRGLMYRAQFANWLEVRQLNEVLNTPYAKHTPSGTHLNALLV